MRKTLYRIIGSLFALSLLIHTSCLDGEINGSSQDTATKVIIGFPTAQCLDRSASQDVSTEQSILDCVVLFTLTITDSFDPIVATFGIGEDITVLVPVGNDRNFMIEGADENGDLCCSGGVTADVFPGQNTIEITCIPIPTPTPTPMPTPTPTPTPIPTPTPTPMPTPIPPPTPTPIPTPSPTPVPTPPPTPIPTPSPTPVPTPTSTPAPCETDAQCPPGQICESGICVPGCRSSEDCPEGEVCIFANDVGMCVPICNGDEDCPPGEICQPVGPFETSICVPGCREDADCPLQQFCDEANMCVPGCTSDDRCPPGKVCSFPGEASVGMCIAGCKVEKPCPGNQVCFEGMCVPGSQVEVCDDGVDNDHNGQIDCADPDCIGQMGPCGETCELPETSCFDGFDNDGDGAVDCDDPDCSSSCEIL